MQRSKRYVKCAGYCKLYQFFTLVLAVQEYVGDPTKHFSSGLLFLFRLLVYMFFACQSGMLQHPPHVCVRACASLLKISFNLI